MTLSLSELDAHEQPSDELRARWKHYAKLDPKAVESERIDDPRLPRAETGFCNAGSIPREQLSAAFASISPEFACQVTEDAPIIHHPLLPGLLIVPNLVPPILQQALIERMIHRDMSEPKHQTNLHLHYDIPYPEGASQDERSFFSLDPDTPDLFMPKDPQMHKPLSPRRVMEKRLHWVTLGGQYDWTGRMYPNERSPDFPPDIFHFLHELFPATLAQAAIVNFYSPGDTMAMHRDVSEETDKGLVSLSFGCDGLFMIAPSRPQSTAEGEGSSTDRAYLVLRLRSGDAIYMTEESRYAWHGVPKVLQGTCPSYLQQLPARDGAFESWRGWMSKKRINLNVRQVKD